MFDLKNIDFIKTDAQHGRKAYSFVGLKRKEDSERLEFWLPLGFDTFDTEITQDTHSAGGNGSFERVKNFFFKMYRTFQVYRERKLKQLSEEERTTNRDGVFEFENGFSFVNKNDEQTVFYGKLNALDKILEGYDELRISSLEKKHVRSADIDYSKIHKYMHQAIYLDYDVIYLDEMAIAKNILIQESPPIIQLFCFIYTEIKKELEEIDSIPDKAFELAEKFKDTYLQPESGLFTEDTFADTIITLKNVFEEIDSKTTYKDEDFWHFYDAIEAFLMGEREDDNQGIYFGISNFYDVWEDLCQTYMLANPNYLPKVLFADVKGELWTRKKLGLKPELTKNPFLMKFNNFPKSRFLKPDLVYSETTNVLNNKLTIDDIFASQTEQIGNSTEYKIQFTSIGMKIPGLEAIYEFYAEKNTKYLRNKNPHFKNVLSKDYEKFEMDIIKHVLSLQKQEKLPILENDLMRSAICIVDYKYMRHSDYVNYNPSTIDEKGENKVTSDIHKQLIYEWAIQKNFENLDTRSEFWIPYYSENLDFEASRQDTGNTNQFFSPSQIKVVKVNFKILQNYYVKSTTTV
jgi:hypothetical protein